MTCRDASGDNICMMMIKKIIMIMMMMMCRGASGDYICSAVNGVGHPAHATLTLTVLCELFDDHHMMMMI